MKVISKKGYFAVKKRDKHSCHDCKYLQLDLEADLEQKHIQWYSCAERPMIHNDRRFPFISTACTLFRNKNETK